MLIRVLGSSAGGGLPQWNCACENCASAREGRGLVKPRTQESVAVSGGGASFALLNASPDLSGQIARLACLRPRSRRDSPIQAVVLTNGDLDHCLGLFSLRESHPLVVYATERVQSGILERNVIARTLERFPGQVRWERLVPGEEKELEGSSGDSLGLRVTPRAVPGKLPLHLEGLTEPHAEDNVGLEIEDREGRKLHYFPGVGAIDTEVRKAVSGAECLFFDGTFWTSDELPSLGVSKLRAEAMAHVPVSGPGGSLEGLRGLVAGQKVFIHVNNTNPMLREGSPERSLVEGEGWRVAEDGQEMDL